jgi:hypothetical protein
MAKTQKNHADRSRKYMYRRESPGQLRLDIPFDVTLNQESRWVRLAKLIPWERIEVDYAKHFHGREGQIAKSARLAFGALYIQASEGFTDEKTREHIQENPHMQYFCGFLSYTTNPPFDSSMMVHFRKRIPSDMIIQITDEVFAAAALEEMDAPEEDVTQEESVPPEGGILSETSDPIDTPVAEEAAEARNRGTLILDATCCPQDIHYPTDIGLLNQARELCEDIIDKLFGSIKDRYEYKPRTYRKVARKDYLAYTKTRKLTAKMIRTHLQKQLNYVARDLRIIKDLVDNGASLGTLPRSLYRKLFVIGEVYRQQKEMYDANVHRCDGRIVSISQPHIRPIVRGKEHTPTEFGSKVAIGLVGGYAFITDIAWENVAEASLLPEAAEQYKRRFGFYPKKIIGDGVYPNRNNRDWCKTRHIQLSGPRLGRKTEEIRNEEAAQRHQDGCERNAVEGEFGTVKRKLSLDRIMPKLANTSKTAIAMGFFAANMERKLRLLFAPDFPSFILYDFELFRLVLYFEDMAIS